MKEEKMKLQLELIMLKFMSHSLSLCQAFCFSNFSIIIPSSLFYGGRSHGGLSLLVG